MTPGRGKEPARDVLRVDPALDRVTAQHDVVLRKRQRLPGGDEDLLPHDVDPRHRLRHRVLDLDARVHLQEVVRPVRSEQPLDRPGRAVADRSCRVDCDRADPRPELVVHSGRRRLLHELLMPPLDRAVALAEVDDVPVVVGEHLHLDVARVVEVALDVHGRRRRSTPRPPGAPTRTRARSRSSARTIFSPLPPPPADGLDRDRDSRSRTRSRGRPRRCARARSRRGRSGCRPRSSRSRAAIFDPIASIASGGGPIQTRPASPTGAREGGVLRQEPVAGMDRLRTGAQRRLDDPVGAEVALRGRTRTDQIRLVGEGDVQAPAVRPRSTRRRSRPRARGASGRRAPRSRRDWQRALCGRAPSEAYSHGR